MRHAESATSEARARAFTGLRAPGSTLTAPSFSVTDRARPLQRYRDLVRLAAGDLSLWQRNFQAMHSPRGVIASVLFGAVASVSGCAPLDDATQTSAESIVLSATPPPPVCNATPQALECTASSLRRRPRTDSLRRCPSSLPRPIRSTRWCAPAPSRQTAWPRRCRRTPAGDTATSGSTARRSRPSTTSRRTAEGSTSRAAPSRRSTSPTTTARGRTRSSTPASTVARAVA